MAEPKAGLIAEVLRSLQDVRLTLTRLQFELESHVRESIRVREDFSRVQQFVEHPETGLVPKHRHLDRSVKVIDEAIAAVHGLKDRVVALETAQTHRNSRMREVGLPLLLIAVAALVGAFANRFLG